MDVVATDRTLPHNLEAERSVLGAILLHNDAFNLAAEVIDSKDFFRDALKKLGEFDVPVKLHRDVTATLKVHVVAEGSDT